MDEAVELLAERAAKGGGKGRPRARRPLPSKTARRKPKKAGESQKARQSPRARRKSRSRQACKVAEAGRQELMGRKPRAHANPRAPAARAARRKEEILDFLSATRREGRQARDRARIRYQGRRAHRLEAAADGDGGRGPLAGNRKDCARRAVCPLWRCSRSSAATTTAISLPSPSSGRRAKASGRACSSCRAARRGTDNEAAIGSATASLRASPRSKAGRRGIPLRGEPIKRLAARQAAAARHLSRASARRWLIEPIDRKSCTAGGRRTATRAAP